MEATTISTKARKLGPGDTVFCVTGDLTVRTARTDQYGTWVVWTNGDRDSFPTDFTVYRVVES